jgi:hypothetical protein
MAPKRPRAATEFDEIPKVSSRFKTGFDSIHDAIQCPICFDTTKEAMITGCGHGGCKTCLEKCIKSDFKCPMCRTITFANCLVANLPVRNVVNALPMVCGRNGCTAEFTFGEKEDHDNNKCPKSVVKCPNAIHGCKFETLRENMETVMNQHIEKNCRKPCAHCGVIVQARKMGCHLQLCPKLVISCPFGNKCDFKDARENVRAHICAYDIGPYCRIEGCTQNIRRHDIENHLYDPIFQKTHFCLLKAQEKSIAKKWDELFKASIEAVRLKDEQTKLMGKHGAFIERFFSADGKVKSNPNAPVVVDDHSDVSAAAASAAVSGV